MGCATSKEVARKRAERESWYAPVTRSVSAPIHYPAENEDDSCHVVSLASSSYGIMEMDKPGDPINKGSFLRILHDRPALVEHSASSEDNHSVTNKDLAHVKSHMKCNRKLQPVLEMPENETGDLETINTWELMEGLDEDGSSTPSPLATTRHFEKSLSFNTVLELDSCFAEMGSPVWKKYYSHESEEKMKGSSLVQRKHGFSHHSSLSFSGAEEHLYNGIYEIKSPVKGSTWSHSKSPPPARSPVTSPLKGSTWSHSKSPPPARSPVTSPLKSPLKTPLRSPSKSPMMEASSPLFDPSLMATFEQALQAITLPQDNWMLMHDGNEESFTNSSASSSNHTWLLSETSSDGESPQSEPALAPQESLSHSLSLKRETSSKVSPWTGDSKISNPLRKLDSFEPRCPPRGEEKVVLYFTSLRGIRKTYEDCCDVRLILQGLGVHVDERDVWMHSKFREELTEVLESKHVQVPRLFIKGRYIGDAENVRQLHEDGVLISLIENLPTVGLFRKVCEGCADVRFIPCLTCCGSCKVLDDMEHIVRCEKCNENGLIMCPICS